MNNKQLSARPLLARYIDFIEYGEAWELQKEYVAEIDRGERAETLLLLQHPPTYTLGTDRHPEHLLLSQEELRRQGIGVYEIDRGGDITYHGPGQLVGYPLMYLDAKGLDLHGYLRDLEQVLIDWLAGYDIKGDRKPEYTGVWVGDRKIAAIGIKFNRSKHRRGFITTHGFALNIKAGIADQGFSGIIPCGIQEFGVTSFEDLTGIEMSLERAAREILPHFMEKFGFAPAATTEEE